VSAPVIRVVIVVVLRVIVFVLSCKLPHRVVLSSVLFVAALFATLFSLAQLPPAPLSLPEPLPATIMWQNADVTPCAARRAGDGTTRTKPQAVEAVHVRLRLCGGGRGGGRGSAEYCAGVSGL